MEEINEIIARSQVRAQQMISAGKLDCFNSLSSTSIQSSHRVVLSLRRWNSVETDDAPPQLADNDGRRIQEDAVTGDPTLKNAEFTS